MPLPRHAGRPAGRPAELFFLLLIPGNGSLPALVRSPAFSLTNAATSLERTAISRFRVEFCRNFATVEISVSSGIAYTNCHVMAFRLRKIRRKVRFEQFISCLRARTAIWWL